MSEDEGDAPTINLERIKASRGGNRAVVTRLEREVNVLIRDYRPDSGTEVKLRSIATTIKEKHKHLKQLDEQIFNKSETQDIERKIIESSGWDTRIYETLEKINEVLREKASGLNPQASLTQNASPPAHLGVGLFSHRAENIVSSPSRSTNSDFHSGIRLPKINLLKFKGDITKFNSFWQSFECAVHNNNDVSKINKLNYLFSLLEGAAYRAVEGLQLQEENYDHVVQILKSRFGGKQQIITAHMQALLKLQHCSNDGIEKLRTIYDNINIHVRGLESLGVTSKSYGSLLVPIIMSRMPREITLQFARKTSEDVWDINEILDIIRRELEAIEVSSKIIAMEKRAERSTQQRPKSPKGTVGSLFTTTKAKGKISCYFCNGEHYSYNCTITDIKERKNILLKAKRCFNCLRVGHIVKDCRSPRGYLKCKGRHHQSICNASRRYETTEVKIIVAQDEAKADNTTVTATTKHDEKVLLQTATAYVYGRNKEERVEVKLLYDNGSQRTYLTEELKKRLSLEAEGSEQLNLNTFGSEQGQRLICNRVKLNIAVENGKDVEVSALTHPTICSPLGSRVDLRFYRLQLADRSIDSKVRIDILIGADFYYNLVIGEVLKSSSGPIAISSKLGWLLSGPVASYDSNDNEYTNIASHLIIDSAGSYTSIGTYEKDKMQEDSSDLVHALSEFWKQESLGLHEKPTDLVDESSKSSELDITFNGTRYQVSLPWKGGNFASLSDDYDLCLARLRYVFNRLKGNPELLNEYDQIFKSQIAEGIIEKVPLNEYSASNCHFISHHCVLRSDKTTSKVRIVFDGSACSKENSNSLNDILDVGDNDMCCGIYDFMRSLVLDLRGSWEWNLAKWSWTYRRKLEK